MPSPEQETQFGGDLPGGGEYVSPKDVAQIITLLEERGYIYPITRDDREGRRTLVQWGKGDQVSVDEVLSFLQGRLTEKGRNKLLNPENPSAF